MNVTMIWAWMLWLLDAFEHEGYCGLCMAVEHDGYNYYALGAQVYHDALLNIPPLRAHLLKYIADLLA